MKFPTGSSRRLKEEFNEVEIEGAPLSGIHGHDLALGSGSYDAVLGAGVFTRYRSAFFQASVQYTVRTTGSYDYRYANDVSFDLGPGRPGLPFSKVPASCTLTRIPNRWWLTPLP